MNVKPASLPKCHHDAVGNVCEYVSLYVLVMCTTYWRTLSEAFIMKIYCKHFSLNTVLV
jgi:hypothetical protein